MKTVSCAIKGEQTRRRRRGDGEKEGGGESNAVRRGDRERRIKKGGVEKANL